MREALARIRAEQGEEAVILSTRRLEDGVEVVSAVDYDAALIGDVVRQPSPAAAVSDAPIVPPAPVIAVCTVTPVEPPAPPSFWNRVKDGVTGAGRAVTGAARTLTRSVEGAVKPATDALKLTGTTRTVVAIALLVGLTAGAVSLICPAWVSAVLTAGAGASAVAAAHVGATMNRVFASLRLV